MALKVVEFCNKQGIAALPIHDSIIVKKQYMQTLEEMMVREYGVLGFASVPKVIWIANQCYKKYRKARGLSEE